LQHNSARKNSASPLQVLRSAIKASHVLPKQGCAITERFDEIFRLRANDKYRGSVAVMPQ
jgi:hypothetical protein